jgi:hypothetical protein
VTLVVLGTIAIVAATIAIGTLVDRKFGILPRPERLAAAATRPALPNHGAGEAPATAIRASSPQQLERLRDGQRCPDCRTVMSGDPDDTVRFAGRELRVLRFRCASCASRRVLYVEES